MKILLLGGTGAIGSYMADILKEHDLSVTTRTVRQSVGSIKYLVGNAKDHAFLKHLLSQKWDVIIDFMVYSTEEFRFRLDLLLQSTSQYIFLSSSRVYANSSSPITEESPRLLDVSTDKEYLCTDEYALSKARQENLLIKSQKKNWTIIRPYITFGAERFQLGVMEKEAWLYRAMHGRPIVFSKDINSKLTTLTSGLDVARGICALLGEKTTLSESFHITSNKSISWQRLLDLYTTLLAENFNYKPKVMLLERDDFIKCHPTKYQILYDRMYDRTFDNQKINEYVKVDSFMDPLEEVRRNLQQFTKSPIFLKINWRNEATKDRLSNSRSSLTEIPTPKQMIKYLFYRNSSF